MPKSKPDKIIKYEGILSVMSSIKVNKAVMTLYGSTSIGSKREMPAAKVSPVLAAFIPAKDARIPRYFFS